MTDKHVICRAHRAGGGAARHQNPRLAGDTPTCSPADRQQERWPARSRAFMDPIVGVSLHLCPEIQRPEGAELALQDVFRAENGTEWAKGQDWRRSQSGHFPFALLAACLASLAAHRLGSSQVSSAPAQYTQASQLPSGCRFTRSTGIRQQAASGRYVWSEATKLTPVVSGHPCGRNRRHSLVDRLLSDVPLLWAVRGASRLDSGYTGSGSTSALARRNRRCWNLGQRQAGRVATTCTCASRLGCGRPGRISA